MINLIKFTQPSINIASKNSISPFKGQNLNNSLTSDMVSFGRNRGSKSNSEEELEEMRREAREQGDRSGNNRAQNSQTHAIAQSLGLTKEQEQKLHEELHRTSPGGYKQVKNVANELFEEDGD